MGVVREPVSTAVHPERVLMGPRPSALLRIQFLWGEALGVTPWSLCIFSLARKHLLDSFPHFLWAQGHHHLSHRGSLLRKERKKKTVFLPQRDSCLVSIPLSAEYNHRLVPTQSLQPRGRECLSLLYFLYLGSFLLFLFFAVLGIIPRAHKC